MRRIVLLIVLACAAPAAWAQIPDSFTNLQLLDKEIEREQLVAIMRDWAGGLGVRCSHCHVGPDNLRGMDFASDEKPAKRTARQMLAMTRKINRELLADLPILAAEDREKAQVVSCYSCHRGLTKPPRQVVTELVDASESGGVEAAIGRFDELKSEHSEAGRYDLRPAALYRLARLYMESGKADDARAMIAALNELYPDFADAYALLAQIEAHAGHHEKAEKALARALEIDPQNGLALWLKRRAAQSAKDGEQKR